MIIRLSLFIFGTYNLYPAIKIDGIHFHHFATGFLLLLLTLALDDVRNLRYLKPLLLGVGLGLIADETFFWLARQFDYWSYLNLLGSFSIGVLLLLFYRFKKSKHTFLDQHHLILLTLLLPPIMLLLVFHFAGKI
jgi:hypothetical protein